MPPAPRQPVQRPEAPRPPSASPAGPAPRPAPAAALKPAASPGSLSAALAQVRSAAAGAKPGAAGSKPATGSAGGVGTAPRGLRGAKAAPALVISDGRLPAALAVWLEGVCRPAAARAAVWHVPGISPAALRVAEALATRAGVTILAASAGKTGQNPNRVDATDVLLVAGRLALSQGLGRVVWPVLASDEPGEAGGVGAVGGLEAGGRGQAGPDEQVLLARTADVLDRALLVGRLLSIDAQSLSGGAVRSLTIETPLVDLSDVQIMDLFADSDAPLSGAMVCQGAEAVGGQAGGWSPPPTAGPTGGCGRCPACRRWLRAMREAGLA